MTRAVIRLRSSIKAHREVKDTLRHLRLNKVNHCVLVPEGKTYDGMLQKVKDYVTWGEVKTEVLTNMLIKRGRLSGERPLTNQYLKENSKFESMIKFAEALNAGKCKLSDLKDAKSVFRLHPPRQGLESVKRSYNDRGSLGYRGEAINDLILKMLVAPAKQAKKDMPAAARPKASAAKKPAAPKAAKPVAAPKKAPARKPVKKEDSK